MMPPFAIHHIDLGEPIPTLDPAPLVHGAYVVFWAHGIPLGHTLIPARVLPMSPAMLRTYAYAAIAPAVAHYQADAPEGTRSSDASPLNAVQQALAARTLHYPPAEASVVVCTRDRPESLARCLDTLAMLSPAPAEIIVVDNAPQTDATRLLVEARPDVRYVHEPRPGLDIARNTGVRASRGRIIAFTDDDVQVDPQWLYHLCAGFDTPDVMAVTGLVLPAALDTEPQHRFETHWGFHRGYLPRRFDADYTRAHLPYGVPAWEIGAGASMAFRRDAFAQVGGFDERLDVGAAGCSGDSEFWYRLLAHGWTCHYTPTAVAHHTHRATARGLQSQLHAYMRGHTAALLVQYERHGHRGLLRRLLVSLPLYYVRRLVRGMPAGYRGRYRTLFAEIRGALSGVLFYLRNRNAPSETASDIAMESTSHKSPAAIESPVQTA